MRTLKKATAIALAIVMMFSTVVAGNMVQAEDVSAQNTEYTPITIGQTQLVSITEGGQSAYFSFTPEESGVYIFQSSSIDQNYCDTYATLYKVTANGNERLASDDDGAGNRNFMLSYSYVAGETYILEARALSSSFVGNFNVILIEPPIESIVVQPISIIEKMNGYYANQGTENEFFYYYWDEYIEYTITMKNGDIVEGKGNSFEYNGEYYYFNWTNDQYSNHWEVNHTYTPTIRVMGYETQVQVSIVETPVQSVEIQPISIIERTNGYFNEEGTAGEYFYYTWNEYIRDFTVTMKNGDVVKGEYSSFEYNGKQYSLGRTDDQYSNHWKVNNTYYPTVRVMGYETQVPVSIVETPVQSIEIRPISLLEHANGYYSNQGTEYEYFHYWWSSKMDFVVTMKDGQVITGENTTYFDYNNEGQSFSWREIQNSTNPWTIGNTYIQPVSVLGYETTVDISIIDTPVQSIAIEPISVMEGTNGYYANEGTQDEFYYYNWYHKISNYTITMKNGEVLTGTGNNSIQYDGEWYNFNWTDDQYTNRWTPGHTYTPTVNIMGYNFDVEVTITESPIESIAVEPITLAEYTNGYWNGSGPGGSVEWYYYHWTHYLKYTITLTDGRVVTGNGTNIWIDGEYYSYFSYNDPQYNEHWYAGNTYTVSLSCMGKKVDVPVSVYEKNQTDGYEYLVQGDSAIIIGCSKEDTVLNIPSVIDGYSVIGITDLTYALDYAEELIIPDSVTMLSASIFEWNYDLKKLTIGKGISNIYNEMFIGTAYLEEIIVSEENPYYCSVDGVVYDKEIKTLVVFPRAKKGAYTVPDTVTNIDCLINSIAYYDVQLDLGNSKTGYTVEDGVIYNADKTVIYACDRTKTGKYVMPDTVTTINEGAFQKCSFSEVVVSENVSEIVYAAFSYSMELEKVVLPQNLKAIEWGAFSECENLTEADLPSGLEILDTSSFYKTGITSVTVPGTVTEVGYGAYKESQVAELTLEEGIEVIWGEAFKDTQLKSVVIPDSITHMGGHVFENTPLESVTFGSGLEAIAYNSFANTKLTTVTIPENIAEIGEYAFANSTLEEAIIEKNDVYIFEGAFYNCPLKEIDIEDGVVAISDYAFYGNQAESVVIPDSVTDVTYKSFAESKKLLNIDVPDDLVSIDGTAFDGTAWWDAQADGVVYLENYLYGYKGRMPEGTELTVKDGTTLIANYAFNNEYNLKTLSIPSSVKGIGWSTFTGCLGLEKVTVAESNTAYSTNEEGTILYNANQYAIWKKVESVYDIQLDEYVEFGASAEEWLANCDWQYVHVGYVDGQYGNETCAVTADMLSGFDSMKPGWQTITVDFGKFTCETEIYVKMPEIESIKISKLPNRTEYDLNQALRTTGMVVKGVSPDGTEFEISEYDISGFDSSEAGTKTVTVSYMDFEATFDVEVIAEKVTYTASTNTSDVNLEISVPEGVIDSEAELVVEEKPVGEIEEEQDVQVPQIFKENASQIFDIRFEKEVNEGTGVPETEIVQPSEPVKVSIPVPSWMEGSNCKIYHISNGVPEDMKATYSGGYMVFYAPHFSYYGMVEVNGSSISGLVDYANAVVGDVTVTLSKDNEVCDTVTAIDGSYNFTGLEDGAYVIKFEKAGHAAREYDVTIGGRSVEQSSAIYLFGDINGDGQITGADYTKALRHVKETTLISGYEYLCADVTGDGQITGADYTKMLRHMKGVTPLW